MSHVYSSVIFLIFFCYIFFFFSTLLKLLDYSHLTFNGSIFVEPDRSDLINNSEETSLFVFNKYLIYFLIFSRSSFSLSKDPLRWNANHTYSSSILFSFVPLNLSLYLI